MSVVQELILEFLCEIYPGILVSHEVQPQTN